MNDKEIREQLEGLRKIRETLEAELDQVRDDQAQVVKAANDCEGITMSEAIRLLGLSRPTVYELLKR